MEGLLVFDSTHQGMAMEEAVERLDIKKARLIPTPEKVVASCGLSLKFLLSDLNQILIIMRELSVDTSQLYKIELVNGRKNYSKLEL